LRRAVGALRGLLAFTVSFALQSLLLGTIEEIFGPGRELPPQDGNIGPEPFHDGFPLGIEMSSGHAWKTNAG
jgi:hypothetical protein